MNDPLRSIDLNADLGESFGRWTIGDDEALLDVVSSANIACGFHAGDPATMLRTVRAAADRGVTIGAHVSYPDLAGFGRRYLDMAAEDLTAAVVYQLGALDGMCRTVGTRVRYVKPHGALYHAAARDEVQATAVVAGIVAYDDDLAIWAQPGSVILDRAAQAGLRTVREAFADREYRPDGTLIPRDEAGAVLKDPGEVAERVVRIAQHHQVTAVGGSVVDVDAESVCLHGDSPSAVAMALAVRSRLDRAGVAVRSPLGPAV